MSVPDEIIHQTMRLKIMATLNALPHVDSIEFTRLRGILNATDGNLGTHLATLESAGYVAQNKEFIGRKPRTSVAATEAGRRAYQRHVAYLRGLIDEPATVSPQED